MHTHTHTHTRMHKHTHDLEAATECRIGMNTDWMQERRGVMVSHQRLDTPINEAKTRVIL